MRCPFCGGPKNRVVDSRLARDGRAIRRRRHCEACGERFTTYEVVESTFADVEKRTGQLEPFDADKLVRSMRLACKKRPIPSGRLTDFARRLEARITAAPRRTISSRELGEQVLSFLRELDPVAYVRYASVYRSFASIEQFMNELSDLGAEGAGANEPRDGEEEPIL